MKVVVKGQMMKSVKYLELMKTKLSLKNDRQLADRLQMTTGTISQYMNGKRIMDDEACLAVALALDIHPIEIIGAACMDRAEKSGQHSLWEVFMSRTAQATSAMLALVFVNLFLTVPDAQAAPCPMTAKQQANTHSLYYVKSSPMFSLFTGVPFVRRFAEKLVPDFA